MPDGTPEPTKRDVILAAARRVFEREGYGSSSMDAITREAGVSKATLYAHFGSKEALFAAIVRTRCASGLLDEMGDFDPAALGGAEAILLAFGRRFMGFITAKQTAEFYRMVIADSGRFPELSKAFFAAGPEKVMGRVADLLAGLDGVDGLSIPDPRRSAELFLGMIKGELYLRALLGLADTEDPGFKAAGEALVASATELFLKGHRGPGAAPDREA